MNETTGAVADHNQETRRFWASAAMLMVLIGLFAWMFFYAVPGANRDVVLMLLGALLPACTAAIPNLFGDKDKEKASLRAEVAELTSAQRVLEARYTTLENAHNRLMGMLIERHVVTGDGNRPGEGPL